MKPILAAAVVLCCTALSAAEPARPAAGPVPSANAGKRGTYQVDLVDNAQNKYWVLVPDSYQEDGRAAGIHLFFHGQGGHTGAQNFNQWKARFCEPHRLIGINMQYLDGDNLKDTAGKVAAARQAVLQVLADYQAVPRGAVASFSGGGGPHGLWWGQATAQPTPAWPFTHCSLYGSNFLAATADGRGYSWFVGVGGKEWGMAKPTLGESQCARAVELLAGALKRKGGPDVRLRIDKDKGHSIAEQDVAEAAEQFRRSDLALAPFLFEPAWKGKARAIAATANRLALGQAAGELDKALAAKDLAEDAKAELERLRGALDERVEAVLALMKELTESDTVLAGHYGALFTAQLKGHARAKELAALLAAMAKAPAARDQGRAFEGFAKLLPACVGPEARLQKPEVNAAQLEQAAKLAGERSLTARNAQDLLSLR